MAAALRREPATGPAVLTIRDAQMDALRAAVREDFVHTVVADLRRSHRAALEGLDEPTIRARVAEGVDRAARYRIRDRSNVHAFVVMMFDVSPHFDAHPAIRRVLQDPTIADERRMYFLFARVTPAEWNEAATRAPLRSDTPAD